MDINRTIAGELNINERQVSRTVELFDCSGTGSACRCTIPTPHDSYEHVEVIRDLLVDNGLCVWPESRVCMGFPADELKPDPKLATPRHVEFPNNILQLPALLFHVTWGCHENGQNVLLPCH